MSKNIVGRPKTKAEFIAQNYQKYAVRYNFLPPKQMKGKMEEDWKKLYGPNNGKQCPKPLIKPEVKIDPVEPVKNNCNSDEVKSNDDQDKRKNTQEVKKNDHKKIKSNHERLETTIELLSDDNKSVGFIECKGNDTFLRLPNGDSVPWSHSTPVRLTRNNTRLKDITRLPFSPI